MGCDPEVVEQMEVWRIEEMGLYYRIEAMESVWRHEDNQDLYIGVARHLRKQEGLKSEDPDDEEANVLFRAKQLALKDAGERKPGEQRMRAGDQDPNESPKKRGFGR